MLHVPFPSDAPLGREWHREPLLWDSAKRFSRVIRAADKVECQAGGMSPYQSMLWAIEHGPCWAAYEGTSRVPLGVWGWTDRGAVWSYWQELDTVQSRELLKRTPEMVLEMVEQSGTTLTNYVWEDNKAALDWLKASRCFDLELDRPLLLSNKRFYKFQTKPLEDLRRCATR